MQQATGRKRTGKANDAADVRREAKVPSTQSAVCRRRRPLKLTQPCEHRQPTEAVCAAASACESEPVARAAARPVRYRGTSGDAVPSTVRPAVLSPPFRHFGPPASPLGSDAPVRLSQDAERVYWDPARPSAKVARRESALQQAATENAVVRSSEPAQHQDALFEYWLSNSAAKPVQAGAKEDEASLQQRPALAHTEQRVEPRQDKKALLFDHLAELQRRSKSETASAAGLQRHQQPQLAQPPGVARPGVSNALSNVAAATPAEGSTGYIPGGSTSVRVSEEASQVADAKAQQRNDSSGCASVGTSKRQAVGTGTGTSTGVGDSAICTDAALPSQLNGEQMCRRLVLDTAQCPDGKLLRLLDASTGGISTCELRGQWATSPVVSGDVVNIVDGRWGESHEGIIDNEGGYIILHPDTLVTGTRVAQSFACQRKVVLGAKLNSSVSSVAAMRGTMLHELFEAAVTKRLNTDDEYEEAISAVLDASMQTLYATGEDERSTRLYLSQHIRLVQSWIRTYLRPGSEMVDGKKIDSVLQAEENIWSPQFGLKGKVDLSVNLLAEQGSLCPAALELKTGRKNPQEHQAQVMLYSLLMSQRYGVNVDTGLLLYLSVNLQEMRSVGHSRAAVIGIIMQRNSIALHIRTSRGDGRCRDLPPMIMNAHQCGRCYQKDSCMLVHKAMEGGSAETSGVEGIFEACVGDLSDRQLDYCRSQFQMIDDESADVHADQHEIWTASSRTREASGLGLGQLRIESSEPHGRGRCLYRFSRCDSGPLPSTRIVSGDYVVVSLEWPRRQTGISTGFVHSINNDSVMLSLDTRLAASSNWASQTQQESGRENRLWRLDKDELSTGSGWLRANIARLFTDDQHMRRLRSLLIDLDAPRYGPPSTVHDSDPSLCDKLNAEQARAIDHVLAARDYALILGMPGTGKTTTIARLVQVLARGQKSVLLASFTNAAVDNVLLKLKAHGQDFLRVGNVDSVHQGVVEYTVDGCIGGHTPASLAELYNSAMVVATTCMGTKHDLFRKRRFDYCIVDEASQISQSMCLGPLCCADVFVLVGDHYQLSPLVRSAGAQHKGMSISLFKRLSESHSQAVHQMCSQYRMNESIMNLSSELVYGGQLRCGTPEIASSVLQLPSWPSWSTTDSHSAWIKDVLAPTSPVVFIDTDTISAAEDRSGDALQNVAEAAIVAELVGRLVELGISAQLADMVGIISPYRSQLRVIKAALQRQLQLQGHASSQADRVEVNTVDRYQGRDKDCIILSLVRSNRSQAVGDLLKDWRRINVAITRAKTKMIFVGSASTLRGSAVFDLLITSLARHGRIQSMPAEWLVK